MPRILALLALLAAGCTAKPRYQGDVVLGNFAFTATPPSSSTCQLQPGVNPTPFTFDGVFSYDTKTQVLYLDTDGDWADDHLGTLSGTHFVLHSSALRDLGCGSAVTIDEVLEGDLYRQQDVIDGGCDAQQVDGGPVSAVGDGGLIEFAPTLGCGSLSDAPRPDAGPSCPTCEVVYQLTAVRAQ